jgi:Cu-Zn family superoxide dismutase
VKAVCVFHSNKSKVKGFITLEELGDLTKLKVFVNGLKPNSKHAIHIHESGDLRYGCESLCSHYNPFNRDHGSSGDDERHVGDLGNLVTDMGGNVSQVLIDSQVKLRGDFSVIGRSIVIHEDEDDLGKGGYHDSKTTGHAGKRIACGIIGYQRGCTI